jgi:hypothetical protein
MPSAVRIKADKYGTAIRMLLMRGGGFQARPERVLIVTSDQRKVLEQAKLVETNEDPKRSAKGHARKKNPG